MAQPFWVKERCESVKYCIADNSQLPVLQRDIRKLPEPTLGANRRRRVDTTSEVVMREETSSSTEQASEQTGSATLVGESSGPSAPVTPSGPQPMKQSKRKTKLKYADATSKTTQTTTRYWNEYDFPEDNSGSNEGDDGYYIYVDPDEKFEWPFSNLFKRLKSLFIQRPPSEKSDEEQPMLPSPSIPPTEATKFQLPSSSPTNVSDDESTSSSEPDTTTLYTINRWGVRRSSPLRTINNGTFPVQPHTRYTTPAIVPPEVRQQYPDPRVSTMSLSASVVTLVILSILAATGKRKLRGEVDAGIILGVVATLTFAVVGILAALAGRKSDPDAYSWLRWGLLMTAFVVSCVGCGALLAWVGGLGQI